MAANMMMNVLRKMEHDLSEQKDYMRNLHVIHRNIKEKFNLMAEKFDQQQATMEKLEQQVRKNNTLLFGNDESQVNFENETSAPYAPQPGGKDGLEPSEKYTENSQTSRHINQTNQLVTFSEKAPLGEMQWNGADDNNTNDGPKKADREDNVREFIIITNEMKEIKGLITDFIKTARNVEETEPVQNEEAQVSQTYLNTEQNTQLRDDLKQIMSEIYEMKKLIKETVAAQTPDVGDTPRKVNNQDSPTSFFGTEQISRVNADLTQITSEISDLKELIRQLVAAKETSVDETVTGHTEVHDKETVQISPTYFSADQVRKLNSELKRVMGAYQATNILPNIEVVSSMSPSDEHPVMKTLCAGVFFEAKNNTLEKYTERYGIRLGTKGFKRSEVQDLLTDYPDLTLYDVVREGLKSTYEWNDLSKIYDFTCEYSDPKKMWIMETVQISPTYFDARQLSKLNAELKQIMEKYKDTNIFPNIVVVPNTSKFDDHPVMRYLRQGVLIKNKNGGGRTQDTTVSLNGVGFLATDIQELLRHNPHMCLYDVIWKRLKSTPEYINVTSVTRHYVDMYVKLLQKTKAFHTPQRGAPAGRAQRGVLQ